MKNQIMKMKVSRMPRQKLWMLLAFAYYTNNEDIAEMIHEEVKKRNLSGVN